MSAAPGRFLRYLEIFGVIVGMAFLLNLVVVLCIAVVMGMILGFNTPAPVAFDVYATVTVLIPAGIGLVGGFVWLVVFAVREVLELLR